MIQSLLQLFLFFKKVDVRKVSKEELHVTAKTHSTLKNIGLCFLSFFHVFSGYYVTVELTVCRKCSPVFSQFSKDLSPDVQV